MVKAAAALFVLLLYQCSCAWSPTFLRWRLSLVVNPPHQHQQQRRSTRRFQSGTDDQEEAESSVDQKEQQQKRLEARFRAAIRGQRLPANTLAQSTSLQNLYYSENGNEELELSGLSDQDSSEQATLPLVPTVSEWKDEDTSNSFFRLVWPNGTSVISQSKSNSQSRWSPLEDTKFEWSAPLIKIVDSLNPWRKRPEEKGPKKRYSMKFSPQRTAGQQNPLLYLEDGYWQVKAPPQPPKEPPSFEVLMKPASGGEKGIVEDSTEPDKDTGDDDVSMTSTVESINTTDATEIIRTDDTSAEDTHDKGIAEESSPASKIADFASVKKSVLPTSKQIGASSTKKAAGMTKKMIPAKFVKKVAVSSIKKFPTPVARKIVASPAKQIGKVSDKNSFLPSTKQIIAKKSSATTKAAIPSVRTTLPPKQKPVFPSAKKVAVISKKGSFNRLTKKGPIESPTFTKTGLPLKKKTSIAPKKGNVASTKKSFFVPSAKKATVTVAKRDVPPSVEESSMSTKMDRVIPTNNTDVQVNEQSTNPSGISMFPNSTYSTQQIDQNTDRVVNLSPNQTDLSSGYRTDEEMQRLSAKTDDSDEDPILHALFALPPPENKTDSDGFWESDRFDSTESLKDRDSDLEALKSSLEGVNDDDDDDFESIAPTMKATFPKNPSSLLKQSAIGKKSFPSLKETRPGISSSAKKEIPLSAKAGPRLSPFQKQSTFLTSSKSGPSSIPGSKFTDSRPTIPSAAKYDSTRQNDSSWVKVGKVKKNLALGIKHSPIHAASQTQKNDVQNEAQKEEGVPALSNSGYSSVPKQTVKTLGVSTKTKKQWGVFSKDNSKQRIGEVNRTVERIKKVSSPLSQSPLVSENGDPPGGVKPIDSIPNNNQDVGFVAKQKWGAGPKVLTSNGIIAPVSDLAEQQVDLILNEEPKLTEQRIRIQSSSQRQQLQTNKVTAPLSLAQNDASRKSAAQNLALTKKKKVKVSVVSMENTFVTNMETLEIIDNGSREPPKLNGNALLKGKASLNGTTKAKASWSKAMSEKLVPAKKAVTKKSLNLGPWDGNLKKAQKISKKYSSPKVKLKQQVKKSDFKSRSDTEDFERLQSQLSSVRASTTSEVIQRSSPIAPPSMIKQAEREAQKPKGEVHISPIKKDQGWEPARSLSRLREKLDDRPPSKDETRSKNVGVALSSMMEKSRHGRRETVHQIAESEMQSTTTSTDSTSPYSNYDWEKAQRASQRSSTTSEIAETASPYNNYDWDQLKNRKPQKVTIISDDAEGQLPAPVVPPSMRPTFQQSLPDYITGDGDTPPPTMPPSARQAEVSFGSQSPAPTMRPTFQQSIPEYYAGGPPSFQTDPGIRGSLPPSFQASLPSAEHVVTNDSETEGANGMPDFVTGGSPDPTAPPSFQSSLPEHVTGGGGQGAAPTMPPTGGRVGLPPTFPPFQSSVPERVTGGRELNYQNSALPEQQQQPGQEQPIIGSTGGGRQGPSPTMPPFQSSIPERVTGGRELNFQTPVPQPDQQGDDFVPPPAPPTGPPSFQASLPGAVTGLKQGVRESASQNQMTHQEILLTQISSETRAGRVDQAEKIWSDYVAQYPSAATFLGYSRWVENELGDVNKARSILQETMISKLDEEEYRATWVLRQWATFEKRQGLFERAQLVEKGDIEGLLSVKIEEQQEEEEQPGDEEPIIGGEEDEYSINNDSNQEQDWSESEAYYDEPLQNNEGWSDMGEWPEAETSIENQEWSEAHERSESDEEQWPPDEGWPAEDNDNASYY